MHTKPGGLFCVQENKGLLPICKIERGGGGGSRRVIFFWNSPFQTVSGEGHRCLKPSFVENHTFIK